MKNSIDLIDYNFENYCDRKEKRTFLFFFLILVFSALVVLVTIIILLDRKSEFNNRLFTYETIFHDFVTNSTSFSYSVESEKRKGDLYPLSFITKKGSGVIHLISYENNQQKREFKIEGDCFCCKECFEDHNCEEGYECVEEKCVLKSRRETIISSRRSFGAALCIWKSSIILFTIATSSFFILKENYIDQMDEICENACFMGKKKHSKGSVKTKLRSVTQTDSFGKSDSSFSFKCKGSCKVQRWVEQKVNPRKRFKMAEKACVGEKISGIIESSNPLEAAKLFLDKKLQIDCNNNPRTKLVNHGRKGICDGDISTISCKKNMKK